MQVFLGYLTELGLPLASLDDAIVAAVGPKTASALEERGVTCDVVADDFVAEGLLDTLEKRAVAPAGTRVIIPSARLARAVLPDALRANGAIVDVLPVYDTVTAERLQVPAASMSPTNCCTVELDVKVMKSALSIRSAGTCRRSAVTVS